MSYEKSIYETVYDAEDNTARKIDVLERGFSNWKLTEWAHGPLHWKLAVIVWILVIVGCIFYLFYDYFSRNPDKNFIGSGTVSP